MPRESIQQKLSRVRKPRVHITYDVEVGNAIEQKELPYVVGVLADLSGQPKEALPHIRERKFIEIDRDNFNKVLAGMKPRLTFRVPNRLANDDSQIGVELEFAHLDDFTPERVADKVEPIRKLVEARKRLNELAISVNMNSRLDDRIQEALQDSELLQQIAKETSKPADGGEDK
jgi:type VI secretion system protein ImpB